MKKQPAYGKIAKTEKKNREENSVYFLFLILSGIFQGLMVSLNGQLGNYYSLFGICFFVHAIAAVLLVLYVKGKEKKAPLLSGRAAVCISGRLYGRCDGCQQQLVYTAHRRNGNAQPFCHRADDIFRLGGPLRLVRCGKKAVPFETAPLLRACNGGDFSGRAGIRRRKQWYFILRQLPMVS